MLDKTNAFIKKKNQMIRILAMLDADGVDIEMLDCVESYVRSFVRDNASVIILMAEQKDELLTHVVGA